jgi:hypothetical protein
MCERGMEGGGMREIRGLSPKNTYGLQVDDVIAMGEHGVRMGEVAEPTAGKEMDVVGRGEK